MTRSTSLSRAAGFAVLAGSLGVSCAASAQELPAGGSDLFLKDRFFESFSARLADQLDNRMRHARRAGGGFHVTGLKGPDEEMNAYREAAKYDPQVALEFAAAEAKDEMAREEGESPFGPAMKLPQGLGIFLLGDTGVGEAFAGTEARREFWTHSISGGMDYRIADALLAGFAVSYSGGEADLGSRDYLAEAMTWSLFASVGEGPWHLDGSFNVGTLSFGGAEEYRSAAAVPTGLALAEGTTGDHLWAHLDTGYAFRLGNVELGPVAEFRRAKARFDGFTEGTGAYALTVSGREVNYARFGIGAAASMDVDIGERSSLNIWGRATYQTAFGASDPLIEAVLDDAGSPLMIQGILPDSSFVRAQMGFTADLGEGTQADFSYRTDLGRDDWQSHTIAASIKVKF